MRIATRLLRFSLAIVLGLVIFAPASSALAEPKNPPQLEKVIFVHYPKGRAVKPPPGDKGGGGAFCPYKTSKSKWLTLPVSFYVNTSGSKCSDNANDGASSCAAFFDGVMGGFEVWDVALGQNLSQYEPSSSGLPISSLYDTRDGQNVVGWASLSDDYPNAIAVTIYWRYSWGEIAEADMALNSDFGWTQNLLGSEVDLNEATGDLGAYDVQNTVAHEAGHFLGPLGDLYDSPSASHTMYGLGSLGEVSKRSLECGDVAWIKKLYASRR